MRLLLSVRDPQDCPDDKLRDVLADLMDALGYEYVETDETNWAQKNDTTERIVLPSTCKEAK